MAACNPKFTYEGFQTEDDLGILLTCNFIVYENSDNNTTLATVEQLKLLS